MTGRRRQAFINSAATREACPALVPFGISIEESVLEGARARATERKARKKRVESEREEEGWRWRSEGENEARTGKERIDTRTSERARRRQWMDRL